MNMKLFPKAAMLLSAVLLASACNQPAQTEKKDTAKKESEKKQDQGATVKKKTSDDGKKAKPVATPVEVKIADAEGYQAALKKNLGKVVLVDVWATW